MNFIFFFRSQEKEAMGVKLSHNPSTAVTAMHFVFLVMSWSRRHLTTTELLHFFLAFTQHKGADSKELLSRRDQEGTHTSAHSDFPFKPSFPFNLPAIGKSTSTFHHGSGAALECTSSSSGNGPVRRTGSSGHSHPPGEGRYWGSTCHPASHTTRVALW